MLRWSYSFCLFSLSSLWISSLSFGCHRPGSVKPRKKPRLEDLQYPKLLKLLDIEVGRYIKKKYEVSPGISQCYTCKKFLPTNEVQAGHYISRRYYATRFDLRNIRPQCTGCNGLRSGEWLKFRFYLVEELGEAQVTELEAMARLGGEKHAPREWLIEQIILFREKNR